MFTQIGLNLGSWNLIKIGSGSKRNTGSFGYTTLRLGNGDLDSCVRDVLMFFMFVICLIPDCDALTTISVIVLNDCGCCGMIWIIVGLWYITRFPHCFDARGEPTGVRFQYSQMLQLFLKLGSGSYILKKLKVVLVLNNIWWSACKYYMSWLGVQPLIAHLWRLVTTKPQARSYSQS
jgi:hypothetical protein